MLKRINLSPWKIGLALALACGALLRLGWGHDIEFKGDERFNFESARDLREFPALGMPSSVGLPNPGLSMWIFRPLFLLSPAPTPVGLARVVQVLNVAALLLLTLLILYRVPKGAREPWLWGVALACVNPIDVLLQRKIWAPSLFPIFAVVMLYGWLGRARFWTAVLWGFVGALLGQLQMTGFAYAFAFAGITLILDRRSVDWQGWCRGTIVGLIPLLPWLNHLRAHPELIRGGGGATAAFVEFSTIHHPLTGWIDATPARFALVWIVNALGVGMDYSLFDEVFAFLRYPIVAGVPTQLAAIATFTSVAVFAMVALSAAARLMRERARRPDLASNGAVWIAGAGFGGLVMLTPFFVQRHYLLVTFPFEFVSLALLTEYAFGRGLRARRVLTTFFACQLILSATFLGYIHVNQGAALGDYGVSFGAQPADLAAPPTGR